MGLKIREATPDDNQALLTLTSANAMEGTIALRIDRHPDFFSLLQRRGKSITYVAELGNKLIGCFSSSDGHIVVDRKSVRIHYLSDMKVDKSFQGSVAAFKLCDKMKEYLVQNDANLLLCTVARGNYKVNPLVNGRMGLPMFESVGIFHVVQLLPTRKSPKSSTVEVRKETLDDDLKCAFNSFYGNYQLGKIISSDTQADFLAGYSEGGRVCALSSFDPLPLKQNVVINASPFLKVIISLSKKLPVPRLPSVGEAVRTIYINNFYYRPGHEDSLIELINHVRHMAFIDNYHFVSLALHEKDPLLKRLDRFFKFTFRSEGLIATLQDDPALMRTIASGIPYKDYSLV